MKKMITAIIMIALVFTLIMPMTIEAKAVPKLNKTKLTLTITQKKKNPTYKLKVRNTSKKIKWKTSNKKVAAVSSTGKITAKKKGRAVITAKTGKRTLRCKVTVKDARKSKTPDPTPTPAQKCDHVYEDHWVTFEEYYEDHGYDGTFEGCCYCGIFKDKDAYEQHLFEVGVFNGTLKSKLSIGLHGKSSKTLTSNTIINGKSYSFVKTQYIDKCVCSKCGFELTDDWDNPEKMKNMYTDGRAIPVNPYAASVSE